MLSSFLILSIISSLLTLAVIFIVRFIYRKYVQNVISNKIWILVFISILIPLLPLYKLTNFNFLKESISQNMSSTSSSISHILAGQHSTITKDLAINVNKFETSNITYIILILWLTGSLFYLYHIIKSYRQVSIVKNLSHESIYLRERLEVSRNRMQLNRKYIAISYSSNIDNPMVYGLVFYQIVLPINIVEKMNDKEIEYIILHELSHIRSHDLLINHIYTFFKMIFWFNPALYIMKKIMDNDCEMACDINVLKILNRREYIRYGDSILKCAMLKSERTHNATAQYLLGFNSNIKERIMFITHYDSFHKPRRNKHFIAYSLCILSLLIQAPFLSAHIQQEEFKTDISWKDLGQLSPHFKGYEGSFVLYNEKKQSYSIYNEQESQKRYSPNSTYKMYLALMSFDQNLMSLNQTEQKWNGHQYPFKEWNQNQTLNSSMRYSVNWYYENLNKQLSQSDLKFYLNQLEYGNQDISGSQTYWNESSLKISPIEQVILLKSMKQDKMHFDSEAIRKVDKSITLKQTENYKLIGKTGTGIVNHKETNGWFVGYIETKDNTYYFATHLKSNNHANGAKTQQISEAILKEMELI